MKTPAKNLAGIKVIELKIHRDERGFFVERYKAEWGALHGLPPFIQDNHSCSKPGVIRGMHYQSAPAAQGKLVGVTRGAIWDVVVDLRASSPTFGQWEAFELSAENGKVLWMPPGFGHGFCVLGSDSADVTYKVDAPYSPTCDGGVRFDDPDLGIDWPLAKMTAAPLVSQKDRDLQTFASYRAQPVFK